MADENGANQNDQTPEEIEGGVANTEVIDGAQSEGTPASTQPETPKWKALLPDRWKKDPRLDGFGSLDAAMEGLLDGKKAETQEPGTQDQTQTNEPVEYKFTKDLSKEVDPSGVLHENIVGAIKQLKLPQDQADAIYGAVADSYGKVSQDIRTKGAEKCESTLKESWGDKYGQKMEFVKRAYASLVPKDSVLEKGLKDTFAENNPFVVQLLAQIGESVAEHNPPRSAAVGAELQKNGFLSRQSEKYPWE